MFAEREPDLSLGPDGSANRSRPKFQAAGDGCLFERRAEPGGTLK
jgi:hypothetical protein